MPISFSNLSSPLLANAYVAVALNPVDLVRLGS